MAFYLMLQDDIEIDLDEVLDMDDESDRRTYISVSIFTNSALEFAYRLLLPSDLIFRSYCASMVTTHALSLKESM